MLLGASTCHSGVGAAAESKGYLWGWLTQPQTH